MEIILMDKQIVNTDEKDVYISQNTFTTKQRKLIYINELKALYIDIDCYSKNLSKESVKFFLENDMYGEIPIPNMLVDSGRGLYYIIFLENTYSKDLPKWQTVEKYLFEKPSFRLFVCFHPQFPAKDAGFHPLIPYFYPGNQE